MAVSTTRARWVNVAQPRPNRPGSLVITFTTTKRMPAGAVRMVFTSVIFRVGSFRPSAVDEARVPVGQHDQLTLPTPKLAHLSHCLLCMRASESCWYEEGVCHTTLT